MGGRKKAVGQEGCQSQPRSSKEAAGSHCPCPSQPGEAGRVNKKDRRHKARQLSIPRHVTHLACPDDIKAKVLSLFHAGCSTTRAWDPLPLFIEPRDDEEELCDMVICFCFSPPPPAGEERGDRHVARHCASNG